MSIRKCALAVGTTSVSGAGRPGIENPEPASATRHESEIEIRNPKPAGGDPRQPETRLCFGSRPRYRLRRRSSQPALAAESAPSPTATGWPSKPPQKPTQRLLASEATKPAENASRPSVGFLWRCLPPSCPSPLGHRLQTLFSDPGFPAFSFPIASLRRCHWMGLSSSSCPVTIPLLKYPRG